MVLRSVSSTEALFLWEFYLINKLKVEGLIVHKGSTKAGYWELIN